MENTTIRKKRTSQPEKSEIEMIRFFWDAPSEAFFNEKIISAVTGDSVKTLQCNRWKKSNIPYRKCGGRVLYRKADVITWLEGHKLVTSTSEYSSGGYSHGA